MRKLILVMLTLSAFSCSKKDTSKDCKCGIITDDDVKVSSTFDVSYILTIKNDCSGNSKDFYVGQNTWMDSPVGEPACMGENW